MFQNLKNFLRKIKIILKLYERWIYRKRRIYLESSSLFTNKNGVEIGGPSQVFSVNGPMPLYKDLGSLDNVNYSNKTFWSSADEGNNFVYSKTKPSGNQIISDAINLDKIQSSTYDFLLASHVIEHIANPIKAIYEWKRVIKNNGFLVILAPDKRRTYDKNRKITKIDHIISDYENEISEDDSTHFEEVIKFHDISNDSTLQNRDELKERTYKNFENRMLHHHVYDENLLIDILKHCNLEIINSQVFKPYHIVVIAKKNEESK
jgi:SAM-dependent methyltransferase